MKGVPPFTAQFGPHPPARAPQKLMNDSEASSQRAEREADARAQAAQARGDEAEHMASQRLDQIKDEFIRRREAESAEQDSVLEHDRNKNYEELRSMQRTYDAELNRVRRQGERELTSAQEYYRNSMDNLQHRQDQDTQELSLEHALSSDYERKMTAAELEAARAEHSRQMLQIQEEQQHAVQNLSESLSSDFKKKQELTSSSAAEMEDKFRRQYQDIAQKQQESIQVINKDASQRINEIRSDTASKLAAYSSRQKDPFYKLIQTDADLTENKNAYILEVTIPKHEQKNVNITIRGNQIVLSGYRRNEEKLEVEPGHTQATASFQSFSESFPINWPVDPRGMSKKFDGDTLVVTIPKKGTYSKTPMHKAQAIERLQAERPKFPENLPLEDDKAKASTKTRPGTNPRGSGPVSG